MRAPSRPKDYGKDFVGDGMRASVECPSEDGQRDERADMIDDIETGYAKTADQIKKIRYSFTRTSNCRTPQRSRADTSIHPAMQALLPRCRRRA
jgi:hypothetical protein